MYSLVTAEWPAVKAFLAARRVGVGTGITDSM
jgi:hypothetical protein